LQGCLFLRVGHHRFTGLGLKGLLDLLFLEVFQLESAFGG